MTFRAITREDIPFLKRVFSHYDGFSCDLNCVNLYAWRNATDTRISATDGFLYARFCENGEMTYLFPMPLDGGDPRAALDRMCAQEREEGRDKLRVICSGEQDKWLPEAFTKTERADLHDYIAFAPQLAACEGKRYRHLRNHLAAFESDGVYEYQPLSRENADSFMDVVRDCAGLHDDPAFNTEIDVAQSMLDVMEETDASGLIIFTHGRPIGAILGSMPRADLLDIHLRYGERAYRGIYDAITHVYLTEMLKRYPLKYVSFENDLGIEGLRTAKQRIPPDILAEKTMCACKL